MKEYTITHYRYKSSEVSKLYHLAKDNNINADKLIKDRFNIPCYRAQDIPSEDIFPRGGVTVITSDDGNTFESECSFKDHYNKRRGVKICMGRFDSHNSLPF